MLSRHLLSAGCCLAALVLLLLPLTAAGQTPDPWARFHNDNSSTGYSKDTGILKKVLSWNFDTGAAVDSSCAVVDGRVYVGNGAGTLFCLDALEGNEIWNVSLCPDRGIESSPSVSGGMVLVGDNAGVLHALDASDGGLLWEFATGGEIKSSPTVFEGSVYIGSYDNRVYCLTLEGKHRWNYTAGGYVHTSVAVQGDLAYAGSCDGNLYAFDKDTGRVEWNYSAAYFPSSPAVYGGRVFAGCYDQNLYALDAETGELEWNHTTESDIFSSPAVDGESVFIGSGYNLYSLDIISGERNYAFETAGVVDSSPAVTDGFVAFGSGDKHLYVLDKETGRENWRYKTEGPITASPAVYASNIYIGSKDGYVYCIGVTKDTIPPDVWLQDNFTSLEIGKKFIVKGGAWDDKYLEGVWLSYDGDQWEEVVGSESLSNWTFSLNTSRFGKGNNTIYLRVSDGYHNVTENHSFEAKKPKKDEGLDSFFVYVIFAAMLLVVVIVALVYTQTRDKKK